MNSFGVGNLGESAVLYEFQKHQIYCYLPYGGGCHTDIIADINGSLVKIQVKSSTCYNKKQDSCQFRVVSMNKSHNNYKHRYSSEEVDYFAFYCKENDIIAFIPFNIVAKYVNNITIQYSDKSTRNQFTPIKASDYTLDKMLIALGCSSVGRER